MTFQIDRWFLIHIDRWPGH